jgi:hypothetical protein
VEVLVSPRSQRREPVPSDRVRRIAAVAIAVCTTTTAIVLTVPALGGTSPLDPIGAPKTMYTTDPVATASPTDVPSKPTPVDTPATTTSATTAPIVVNGREQPPRIEPPTAASGRLVVVPGSAEPGPGDTVLTYRVEIEAELPFDGPAFAAAVHTTLADPRGWAAHGYAFRRVDSGNVDFRLILASPDLTDKLCAPLLTRGQVSCRNGDAVVLNALRWGTAIDDYAGDIATYREYMVNHEVGHRLGRGHTFCPGAGQPAPVMMQQTYGLVGCTANAWPLPQE